MKKVLLLTAILFANSMVMAQERKQKEQTPTDLLNGINEQLQELLPPTLEHEYFPRPGMIGPSLSTPLELEKRRLLFENLKNPVPYLREMAPNRSKVDRGRTLAFLELLVQRVLVDEDVKKAKALVEKSFRTLDGDLYAIEFLEENADELDDRDVFLFYVDVFAVTNPNFEKMVEDKDNVAVIKEYIKKHAMQVRELAAQ